MKSVLLLATLFFSVNSFAGNSEVEITISPERPTVIFPTFTQTVVGEDGAVVSVKDIVGPWAPISIDVVSTGEEKLVIINKSFYVVDPISGVVHQAESHSNVEGGLTYVNNMLAVSDIFESEMVDLYKGKNFRVIAHFEGWFEVDGQPVRNFSQTKEFTAEAPQ